MAQIDPNDPMFREILLASIPPAPREPTDHAKALVHGYTGSQAVQMILGVVFLGIGVPFGVVAVGSALGEIARTGNLVSLALLPFGLIFPALGGGLAWMAWKSNQNEIRAWRDGVPAIADVTYSGPDRTTKVNGKHPHMLRWRFVVGGTAYAGEISCLDREPLEQWIDKAVVPVLYLRENPAANTLYVE